MYGHHRDYESLARARELGCVVCLEFNAFNDEDDINETFAAFGYYSVFAVTLSQASRPEMSIYVGDGAEYVPCEMVEHDCKFGFICVTFLSCFSLPVMCLFFSFLFLHRPSVYGFISKPV